MPQKSNTPDWDPNQKVAAPNPQDPEERDMADTDEEFDEDDEELEDSGESEDEDVDEE